MYTKIQGMTYNATKLKRWNSGKVKNTYGKNTNRTLLRRRCKCSQCGNLAVYGIRCLKHALREQVRKATSLKGNYKMALKGQELIILSEKLENKLQEQNKKCYYTGLPIDLGKNASLDHIFPSSTHPEKRADIENLVWVDKRINYLKSSMQPKMFYEFMLSLKEGIIYLENNKEFLEIIKES